MTTQPRGNIRTVLGDRDPTATDIVYAHEHLIIDSPLIAASFPHIHLFDTDAAVDELRPAQQTGLTTAVDAMPCSAGRLIKPLAEISRRSGVDVVASTGLHHDRYYGPSHWTNNVSIDDLTALFIADLLDGIDEFDYTGPLVRRTEHRAGIIKVATSGASLDDRDRRNIDAAAGASAATGAPVITHCEGGWGGTAQIDRLVSAGVPASSILLSHVDKSHDLRYLRDLAETGAILEFDQALRNAELGPDSFTVKAIAFMIDAGFVESLAVGTDGARRTLWNALGGTPGLSWLATMLPIHLEAVGVDAPSIRLVMGGNAARALTWREVAA